MNVDRHSIRSRPAGRPVMHQTWSDLLFLHWRVPEAALRPLVPAPLEIDAFDGTAWIGVTPFTMPKFHLPNLPAVPVLCGSHEINVRTYVHRQGVPGVWFLSLDASNPLAVLGARLGFGLPYYQAIMRMRVRDAEIRFTSTRTHPGAPRAVFQAAWRREAPLPEAKPGSLEFFLTERYCLYASRAGRIFRSRIHHGPWPLCRADLLWYSSTMVETHGLHTADDEPLVHAQAAPLEVDVWAPSRA